MSVRGIVRRIIQWAYDCNRNQHPLFGEASVEPDEGNTFVVWGYGIEEGGAYHDLLFLTSEIDGLAEDIMTLAEKVEVLEGHEHPAPTPVLPNAFCRARPTANAAAPVEHVHQFPYTEADAERYRTFGYAVETHCVVPGVPFDVVDGDPEPKRLEVLDALNQTHQE